MVYHAAVCCLCGDFGFSEKLFRCERCFTRYQHTYVQFTHAAWLMKTHLTFIPRAGTAETTTSTRKGLELRRSATGAGAKATTLGSRYWISRGVRWRKWSPVVVDPTTFLVKGSSKTWTTKKSPVRERIWLVVTLTVPPRRRLLPSPPVAGTNSWKMFSVN